MPFTHDSQDTQNPKEHNDSERTEEKTKERSLWDFLVEAQEYNASCKESLAYDEYRSPLFEFVRYIMQDDSLRTSSSSEVEELLDSELEENGYHDWSDFFEVEDCSDEDLRVEFHSAWERVRFPVGVEVLQTALERAGETPLTPPTERTPLYAKFISFVGWLQVLRHPAAIYLPCRKIAALFTRNDCSLSPMTISSYRRWALADELLKLTRPHRFSIEGELAEATEFSFDLKRYPELLAAIGANPGEEE
jgi:hypothetical protein